MLLFEEALCRGVVGRRAGSVAVRRGVEKAAPGGLEKSIAVADRVVELSMSSVKLVELALYACRQVGYRELHCGD